MVQLDIIQGLEAANVDPLTWNLRFAVLASRAQQGDYDELRPGTIDSVVDIFDKYVALRKFLASGDGDVDDSVLLVHRHALQRAYRGNKKDLSTYLGNIRTHLVERKTLPEGMANYLSGVADEYMNFHDLQHEDPQSDY